MASRPPQKPAHLEPSPLGTKEYWESLYTTEISNNSADPSDVGTIWFDDSSAEEKVLEYLYSPDLGLSVDTTSFLDIGTGNGHFLFRLREGREVDSEDDDDDEDGEDEVKEEGIGGFRGRIMGTDYSQKSVEFATQLAAQKGYEPGTPLAVEFQYFDVLNSPSGELLSGGQAGGWDMVLDKGTFDAISLSAEVDGQGRRIVEGYRDGVVPLIAEGGCFLVTSCNWIEEELRQWFEGPYQDARGAGKLEYVGRVPYRSFSFGGKKGQTISTVCFRKVVDQWNS